MRRRWDRVARGREREGPGLRRRVRAAAYGARAAAAPFVRPDGLGRIPCVYVDVASSVAGTPFPALPDPAPPAAVVRGEVPFETIVPVLRRLCPPRPARRFSSPGGARARPRPRGVGPSRRRAWTRVSRREAPDPPTPPRRASLARRGDDSVRSDARARPGPALPVLSLDRGRFGKGAAVVVASDAALVGRVAADAARRLRDGEGADRALRLTVRIGRGLLDLDAADAQRALDPPLPFVASADRVRWSRKPGDGRSGR